MVAYNWLERRKKRNSTPPTTPDEDAWRHGSGADCLSAATNYSTGEGVPQDEARAAEWFEAACTLRSGPDCNLAGRMHEFARGVPADLARALSFYEPSCALECLSPPR